MLHNSICLLQDCSVLLFLPFQLKHMEVFFHWRRVNQGEDRMCSKSITNHWKSVRDVLAWFQRDTEALEVFTGYSIGFNVLLCTYSLTQKCTLVTAECFFSKSYYISAGHFSKVIWVQHVHKNKGNKLLFSSTSHCCRVEWGQPALIGLSCVQSVPCFCTLSVGRSIDWQTPTCGPASFIK